MSSKIDEKLSIKRLFESILLNEIEHFYNEINFYQVLLNHLKDEKPFFFQKKKIIEYNLKVREYSDKIELLYVQLGEKVDTLYK